MSGAGGPRGATFGVAPIVPAVVVGQTLTPTTAGGLSFLLGVAFTAALAFVLHRQRVFENLPFLRVSRVDSGEIRNLYDSVVDSPGKAHDTAAEKVAAIRREIEGEPEGGQGGEAEESPPDDGEEASDSPSVSAGDSSSPQVDESASAPPDESAPAPVDEATRAQSIDAEAMERAVADQSPPPDSSAGRLRDALDPESEGDPTEPLEATVAAASKYDRIEETFGTSSEEAVRRRGDDLRETLSEMDGPAARAVESAIERLLEDVSTAFGRSPEAIVAAALLDYVGDELPEEVPGEPSVDESLDDSRSRYDDLRSRVRSEFENDQNGVSSDGNEIAQRFVELAESLHEDAKSHSADGETEAARIRIDAAVRVLERTLDLYQTGHLRRLLTRV